MVATRRSARKRGDREDAEEVQPSASTVDSVSTPDPSVTPISEKLLVTSSPARIQDTGIYAQSRSRSCSPTKSENALYMISKRDEWDLACHDAVDPTIEFFYTPHNITLLLLTVGSLVYYALHSADDFVLNTRIGIVAMIFVIVVVGVMQFRDGPFIRPHPAFWRIVLALGLVYQLLLIFIAFQTKDNVRYLLSFVDSKLGNPLPEKSYAQNCDLTWNTLWDQMDEFVFLHAAGWFLKALVLRDNWICWIISILFEVMEYSLEHQLPNFAECWWDHWIMDVFTTNWLGIYLGMKACKFFELKTYSWRGIRDIPSMSGKLKRTVAQFTPHSWTAFHWDITESFGDFCGVIALVYLELQCELNAFYLKYLLWIPVTHPINAWRLIFFFFACLPATREVYQFLRDPRCNRLGAHAWMTAANILTELLIIVKFSEGEFNNPTPYHVIVFWSLFVFGLVSFAIWNFLVRSPVSKNHKIQ